jgi:hypothetical protein
MDSPRESCLSWPRIMADRQSHWFLRDALHGISPVRWSLTNLAGVMVAWAVLSCRQRAVFSCRRYTST